MGIHGVACNGVVGGVVDVLAVQVVIIAVMIIVGQLQLACLVEAHGLGRLGSLVAVQGNAVGIQVDQHIDGVICSHRQRGVDKAGRTAVVHIAVIAQVVGKGIAPVCTAIGGAGHDGIQTAAVIGGVPTGISCCHDGAVAEGHHGGNTEAVAVGSALFEGLAGAGDVGRHALSVVFSGQHDIAIECKPGDCLDCVGSCFGFFGSCLGLFGSCLGFLGSCLGFFGSCFRFFSSCFRFPGGCRGHFGCCRRLFSCYRGFLLCFCCLRLGCVCISSKGSHGDYADQHTQNQEHRQNALEYIHIHLPPRYFITVLYILNVQLLSG